MSEGHGTGGGKLAPDFPPPVAFVSKHRAMMASGRRIRCLKVRELGMLCEAVAWTVIWRRLLAALGCACLLLSGAAWAQDSGETLYQSDQLIVTGSADTVMPGKGAAFVTIAASSVISDNVLTVADSVHSTQLVNSLMRNQGIMQVNQDAGIGANQANIVAISVAAGAGTVPVGVAILSDARYTNNTINVANVARTNIIENILDGSSGIAQVNQNSGNLNRSLNAVGIALGIGKGDVVLVTEGNLAATTAGAQFNFEGTIQASGAISGARNFSGIGQIAQIAGDGNVVVNSLAIGVVVVNR